MAKVTSEELIIKNLRITIKNISNGKTPPSLDEEETGRRFSRLKPLNIGMHDELLTNYNRAVLNYQPASIPASKRLYIEAVKK